MCTVVLYIYVLFLNICSFPKSDFKKQLKNYFFFQKLTIEQMQKWRVDLIVMSPPCQPFTRVGKKRDVDDVRAKSFLHVLHLVAESVGACIALIGQNMSSFWVELVFKKGRKEMFLFNDTLNTFYLRLYGVRHMVKDHSDSEKGNPLPPHRLLFPINSKDSFICTIPQTG